jgi:putative intracellular protease/amidase
MAIKVLMLAPNYGGWGEEQQAPWDIFRKAGFEVTLATPRGKKPLPLTASVDPDFIDPIQNYHVNPPEVCKRVKELVDSREWESAIKIADAKMSDYDAIVLTCGPGAILDINGRKKVHDMLLEASRTGKLIGALCYAVASLVFTRDPKKKYKSIIYGKKITAHPRAWDFHFDLDHSFLYGITPDNQPTNVVTPGFIYPLQDIATDAVGPKGKVAFADNATREKPSVVYDHPFVTGCSVESSIAFANKIVGILKKMQKGGLKAAKKAIKKTKKRKK